MDDARTARKPRRNAGARLRFVGFEGGFARAIAVDGPVGREYAGICRRVGVNAPGRSATYAAELWPAPRPEPRAEGDPGRTLGPGYATRADLEKAVRAEYRDGGAWWR